MKVSRIGKVNIWMPYRRCLKASEFKTTEVAGVPCQSVIVPILTNIKQKQVALQLRTIVLKLQYHIAIYVFI